MSAPRSPGVRPGHAVVIEREPYDSPVARELAGAMMAEVDERYAADGPADGDAPEVVAAHRVRTEQVTPPRGVFVIAWADGDPVGCGAVRPLLGGPADVAEIKRMYTTPEARGRGISRALLARLEAEAVGFGYRRVQLESGLRQPEALRLYETAGYHRIPDFGQYAGDELTVCFAKDLRPA